MIYVFFIGHWIASVFFQSFFQHRYAAHRMYTMSPRTERVFHLLTYLVQGPSYLSPRGYAILHRQHHAFSDTERDPHSPWNFRNALRMMLHTKHRYDAYAFGARNRRRASSAVTRNGSCWMRRWDSRGRCGSPGAGCTRC